MMNKTINTSSNSQKLLANFNDHAEHFLS